jgi:hypothetical protein
MKYLKWSPMATLTIPFRFKAGIQRLSFRTQTRAKPNIFLRTPITLHDIILFYCQDRLTNKNTPGKKTARMPSKLRQNKYRREEKS